MFLLSPHPHCFRAAASRDRNCQVLLALGTHWQSGVCQSGGRPPAEAQVVCLGLKVHGWGAGGMKVGEGSEGCGPRGPPSIECTEGITLPALAAHSLGLE